MSNQWISPLQCVGLPGMPKSIQGVHKMAKREGWNSRRREGVQGSAVEFLLNDLPIKARVQIIKTTGSAVVVKQRAKVSRFPG